MPMHNWAKADAGIYPDFHNAWAQELKKALNAGILPTGLYATTERHFEKYFAEVLTLRRGPVDEPLSGGGGLAVAVKPPKTRFQHGGVAAGYADRARSVVVHRESDREPVALIEIVSPGNKDRQAAVDTPRAQGAQLAVSRHSRPGGRSVPAGKAGPTGIASIDMG